ncbi:unnamed protein product, partial [Staurois parvus]
PSQPRPQPPLLSKYTTSTATPLSKYTTSTATTLVQVISMSTKPPLCPSNKPRPQPTPLSKYKTTTSTASPLSKSANVHTAIPLSKYSLNYTKIIIVITFLYQ